MAETNTTLGNILAESIELARRHAGVLAIAGTAIVVGYTLLDTFVGPEDALFPGLIAAFVVIIPVQYFVTEHLLADRIQPEVLARRRYGSLFAASFLSSLAITLGLVFLVVPGMYLAGRWLASSAFVVAEGKGGTDSLRASWDASFASQNAHVIAALISIIPNATLAAWAWWVFAGGQTIDGLTGSIILNVLNAVSVILPWMVGSAAYRVTRPNNSQLAGVFA